jgi:hypothetical protein
MSDLFCQDCRRFKKADCFVEGRAPSQRRCKACVGRAERVAKMSPKRRRALVEDNRHARAAQLQRRLKAVGVL